MVEGATNDEVETIAARVEQLELSLLEVVTALGLLVADLAGRRDLALERGGVVETALANGWQTLIAQAEDAAPPAGAPPPRVGPEWADAEQLARLAPSALSEAVASTGAAVGAVYGVEPDGSARLLASLGYPPDVMTHFALLPPDADLPVSEVIRSGRPLWFAQRQEIVDAYPHLREAQERTERALGAQDVQGAVVPLAASDRVAAVVIVGFAGDVRAAHELDVVRARVVRAVAARANLA